MSTHMMALDVVPKVKIHLRNGQVIEGIITSRNEQQVEVETLNGMNYTFAMSDIDHISHETRKKNYDTAKFRGFIDLGYSLGMGQPRNNFWLIETSFGYAITPRAYLGAGIGIHNFKPVLKSYPQRTDKAQPEENDPNWRYPFIPIYAEGRYSFKNESSNTPFVSLKVGATISRATSSSHSTWEWAMRYTPLTTSCGALATPLALSPTRAVAPISIRTPSSTTFCSRLV